MCHNDIGIEDRSIECARRRMCHNRHSDPPIPRQGYDYRLATSVDPPLPPFWAKVQAVLDEMERGQHQYILLLDTDAVVRDVGVRFEERFLTGGAEVSGVTMDTGEAVMTGGRANVTPLLMAYPPKVLVDWSVYECARLSVATPLAGTTARRTKARG
jgi:hypothetical protein